MTRARSGKRKGSSASKRPTLADMPFSRLVEHDTGLARLRRQYASASAEERKLAAQWEYDRECATELFNDALSVCAPGQESPFPRGEGPCPGAVLALAIDPNYAPAMLTVGSAEAQLGRLEEAVRLLLALPALPPETEDLWDIIDEAADILLDEQDYENAEALYAAAAQRFPDAALFYDGLSYCAARMGRLDEAIAHARRASDLEPQNPRYLNDIGWSLLEAGRYDDAERVIERAAALSAPEDRLARNNLDELRRRKRRAGRKANAPGIARKEGCMAAQKPRIAGTFRIVHMDAWDEDCLDIDGPPFIRFERGGEGALRFGTVEAGLDFRNTKRDGATAVEFSFQGSEEGEDVFGRGWAVLDSPGHIKGMLFFHLGDESGFAAERVR